ncbi:MAG: cytochrome b [Rhodospirillales bacterium]|nr:cytochrome b [Rhodospirillales bacterium]
MQVGNTTRQWGAVQQAFHWTIAVLVVAQLIVGFWFGSVERTDPIRGTLFGIHTSLGVSLLVLMLARLGWRAKHPVPLLPDTLSPFQKRLAHATHWLFYILVIGMPAGAYLAVNAHGHTVPFFGLELPILIGKSETASDIIMTTHVAGAFILSALVVVHAIAALRHEFVLKDNTLRRMTPLSSRPEH